MADDITQIKNPSLLPESLQFGIEDNKIVSISGYQLAGGGGSTTQSDFVFYPDVVDGNLSFTLGTTGQHPGPMGPYYISGGKGDAGFSPTITLTSLSPDPLQIHTQGGTQVDITYLNNGVTATATYTAWNGENGQDATVNLAEGAGIQITQNSNTYTISVSADYSGAAVTSAKTWVEQQGYLTSVPDTYALKSDIPTKVTDLTDSADYAKKTDLDGFVTSDGITTQGTDYVMTTTGWKVLSLPGGGMTQVIHDTTLTGQGNADNDKLGVAWSALSGNTIASALSAGSAIVAANLGTSSFVDITGAINAKADATAISDMLTKTEAAQTYQTIAGMSDYLTTTVASQTYLDKTTYATDSATYVTSSNLVITGTKQYALTTTGWSDISLSAYLPLTGGTVSGQLTVSGSNFDNNLHLKRGNSEGFIGLAGNGAITFKNVISNSTSQIEFLTSANKTFDITVKDNSTTPQSVGKLYVMSAHSLADATATSANWANDGMLHIILES